MPIIRQSINKEHSEKRAISTRVSRRFFSGVCMLVGTFCFYSTVYAADADGVGSKKVILAAEELLNTSSDIDEIENALDDIYQIQGKEGDLDKTVIYED